MTHSNKRLKGIIGVASLALVVILAVPSKEKGGTAATTTSPEPSVPDALPTAVDPQVMETLRHRAEQLTWGRDPFRPPSSSEGPAPPVLPTNKTLPRLTGMSSVGDARMAIIDREVVGEGDRLASGYTVGSIGYGVVTLLLEGEEVVLSLGAEHE